MASLTAAGDVREGLDFAGAADGQARLDVEARRREERLRERLRAVERRRCVPSEAFLLDALTHE